MLPILINHEHHKPIGFVRAEGDRLFVEFKADMRITREMFFEIFGNAGMLAVEADTDGDVVLIRKAQIMEFSWSPVPVSPQCEVPAPVEDRRVSDTCAMTDRQLLEAAALAAGLDLAHFDEELNVMLYPFRSGYANSHHWNPLIDDGDALRLAVRRFLTIQQRDDHVKVGWQGCVEWVGETCLPCDSASRGAATRRAIVRAAIAIDAENKA